MIDKRDLYLARENAKQTVLLSQIPEEQWIQKAPPGLVEVWRNQRFLVQIYRDRGFERMSVVRSCKLTDTWADGITWDEMQRMKAECGRGDQWAVEVYPAEDHIVNVANMRHLWILSAAPEYAWKKDEHHD